MTYGFIGPSSELEGKAADSERLVNMYPELIRGTPSSKGAKYQYVHTPGFTLFAQPDTTIRAMWGGNNRLFILGDTDVFEVFSDATSLSSGTVGGSGSGPGQIISNGEQLLVWNGDDGFTAWNTYCITGGPGPPTSVISSQGITYIDGYFVALRPGYGGSAFAGGALPINTGNQTQFNYSALLDGTSWDPLAYMTRNGAPDALQMLVGPGSFNGGPEELWLMGKKTTEIYYNSGNQPPLDPFSRVHGAFINCGVWARHSIVGFPHTVVFLSADDRGAGVVMAMNGYQPVRISDHALENNMRQYTMAGLDTSDAIGYGYQENGHTFYVLTFPQAAKQWVFDFQSEMWHQRAAGTNPDGLNNAPGMFHAYVFGKHLVGDPLTGNIYEASRTVYRQNGSAILRMRVTPTLNNERKRLKVPKMQLDVGGPFGSNRTYTQQISTDAGQSWGTARNVVIGPTGDSPSRAIWRRNGAPRQITFRVTSQNNSPECWVDGYVEVEKGVG